MKQLEKRKRVSIPETLYDSIAAMAKGADIPVQELIDELMDKAMKLTEVAVVTIK